MTFISIQLHTTKLDPKDTPLLTSFKEKLEKYLTESGEDYLTYTFETQDIINAWIAIETLLEVSCLKKIALVTCQDHNNSWDNFISLHSYDANEQYNLLKANLNYLAESGFAEIHKGAKLLLALRFKKEEIQKAISELCEEARDNAEKEEVLLSISDALYGTGPKQYRL